MEFMELPIEMREAFLVILNNHLEVAQVNLENDKTLFPLLAFLNKNLTTQQVIPLQPPMAPPISPDMALNAAVQILTNSYFEKAIFSCSTMIREGDSEMMEAVKTVLFDGSGVGVTFYTPYRFKGLFTKRVVYSQNIIDSVNPHMIQRNGR